MMRHILIVLVLLASAPPALAAEFAQIWARHLALEGYQDIRLSRTWLGRVRIVAEKSDREREIVINPRTGEVLRDLTRLLGGGTGLPPDLEDAVGSEEQEGGNSGSSSENSGSGSENSGSGSSNSGSGSSNSGSGSSNSGSGSSNSGSGSSNSGSGSSNSGSGSGSDD